MNIIVRRQTVVLGAVVVLWGPLGVHAKPLKPETAMRAAEMLASRLPVIPHRAKRRDSELTSVFRIAAPPAEIRVMNRSSEVLAFAFRLAPRGFLLVAGDDRFPPLLGFSTSSSLDLESSAGEALRTLLRGTVGMWLAYLDAATPTRSRAAAGVTQWTLAAQEKWRALLSTRDDRSLRDWAVDIGPLLSTVWGQCYDTEHLSSTGKPST